MLRYAQRGRKECLELSLQRKGSDSRPCSEIDLFVPVNVWDAVGNIRFASFHANMRQMATWFVVLDYDTMQYRASRCYHSVRKNGVC